MNIDILAEYVELCHLMSFEKAARKCHVTESCLSRHMTELEKEVGAKLFLQRRKLSLTPAGKRLLSDGVKILMLHDKCIAECRRLDKAKAREILVYHHPVRFDEMKLLSQGILKFKRTNPESLPSLVSFDGKTEIDVVSSGKADIAIMPYCAEGEEIETIIAEAKALGIKVEPFCTFQLSVVYRIGHPLEKARRLDGSELSQHTFAVPASRTMDFYRRAVLALVNDINFDISYSPHTADSIVELVLLAEEDEVFLGTPGMAEEICSTFADEYEARPVDDPRFKLEFYLVYRTEGDDSDQVAALAQAIADATAE